MFPTCAYLFLPVASRLLWTRQNLIINDNINNKT
jgi:hypothetical protein